MKRMENLKKKKAIVVKTIPKNVLIKKTEGHTKEIPMEIGSELVDLDHVLSSGTTKAKAKKITNEFIEGMLESFEDIFITLPEKPKRPAISKNGACLCLGLSDWHIGKIIHSEFSNTVLYDSKIAYERITKDMYLGIIDFLEKNENQNINEIAFIFAGDIVENDIVYETQRLHIDSGVAEQFDLVCRAIVELIYKIQQYFKTVKKTKCLITIYGVTGNHGRASESSKDEGKCSWDYAVYSALDLAFRVNNVKDIVVEYSTNARMIANIKGHQFLIQHEAPPQIETPSAKAKFGGWKEKYKYDLMFFGHRHHYGFFSYNDTPIIMNASLCGTDSLANRIAAKSNPSQMMWITTETEPVAVLKPLEWRQ